MKLYCTTYYDDEKSGFHDGVQHKWYGTQVDQKRDAKALKAAGMRNISPNPADVPTSKPELLAWLNERGVRP
jgi:hypothetical protein